jgi:hypothetical protein
MTGNDRAKNGLKRPTILFSTTRSWNPGDDFILFGVRNLLEPIIGPFNALVYNRNPELFWPDMFLLRLCELDPPHEIPDDFFRRLKVYCQDNAFDNSWHGRNGLEDVSLAVFAGTPEWFGFMAEPLVESLGESDTPCIYLGIGSFESTQGLTFERFPEADKRLLRKAALITVRDPECGRFLAPLATHHLPCPALFASKVSTQRTGKKRIALSTQCVAGTGQHGIEKSIHDFSVALFTILARKYECTLICHHVDELSRLREPLGGVLDFYYSYDPADYLAACDQFDLTVTTRVHGAGLFASLGIPAFLIAHSARSSTADGFLSQIVDPASQSVSSVVDAIDAFDIAAASRALVGHKESSRQNYDALLGPVLNGII